MTYLPPGRCLRVPDPLRSVEAPAAVEVAVAAVVAVSSCLFLHHPHARRLPLLPPPPPMLLMSSSEAFCCLGCCWRNHHHHCQEGHQHARRREKVAAAAAVAVIDHLLRCHRRFASVTVSFPCLACQYLKKKRAVGVVAVGGAPLAAASKISGIFFTEVGSFREYAVVTVVVVVEGLCKQP